MNNEFALKLARMLRESETFNQRSWFCDITDEYPCGTPACVAGHATILDGWETVINEDVNECDLGLVKFEQGKLRLSTTMTAARQALGLSEQESHRLFGGNTQHFWPEGHRKENPTGEDAARLLEALVAGEVSL